MQFIVSGQDSLAEILPRLAVGDEVLLKASASGYEITVSPYVLAGLSGVRFTSYDADDPATIVSLKLNGASDLEFDGLAFGTELLAKDRADTPRDINISNCENITIRNCVMEGGADTAVLVGGTDDKAADLGIIRYTDGFIFENNIVSKYFFGIACLETTNIQISGNEFLNLQADPMRLGGVRDVTITDNYVHDLLGSDSSVNHMDMIQFWSSNTVIRNENITISNNILSSNGGAGAQGIFMRNEQVDTGLDDSLGRYYKNITIADNVIYGSAPQGIAVGESIGLTIARNTLIFDPESGVLTPSGPKAYPPRIRVSADAQDVTIVGNVASGVTGPNGAVISGNLEISYDDRNEPTFVDKLFINAESGGNVSLDGLRALPGGLADALGVGAAATRFDPAPAHLTPAFTVDEAYGAVDRFRFDASLTADAQGFVGDDRATFIWTFDDGVKLVGAVIERAFSDYGWKQVALSVTTTSGESATALGSVRADSPELLDITVRDGSLIDLSDYGAAINYDPAAVSAEGLAVSGSQVMSISAGESQLYDLDQFVLSFDLKRLDADAGAGVVAFIHMSFRLDLLDDGEIAFSITTTDGVYDLVTQGAGIDDTNWRSLEIRFDSIAGVAAIAVDDIVRGSMAVSGSTQPQPQQYWGLTFGSPWKKSFEGYIDGIRMIAGTTEPTPVPTELEVLLDIDSQSGILFDSSEYSAHLTYDPSKLTDGGVHIGGGDVLAVGRAETQLFGLDQFTLSFDMQRDAADAGHGVVAFIHLSFSLVLTRAGELSFAIETADGASFALTTSGADITSTKSRHVDVDFDGVGGVLSISVDGVEYGATNVHGATKEASYWGLTFGSPWKESFTGVLDGIRVTHGSIEDASQPDSVPDSAEASAPAPVLLDIQSDAGTLADLSDQAHTLRYDPASVSDAGVRLSNTATLSVAGSTDDLFDLDQFTLAFDMKRELADDGAGRIAFVHLSYTLSLTTANELAFTIENADGERFSMTTSGADIDDTAWRRVGVSFDGVDGVASIFVDGVSYGSTSVSGATKSREFWDLTFGNPWSDGFDGTLDSISMTAGASSTGDALLQLDRDIFVFSPGDGRVTVSAFDPGYDQIDLSAFGIADFDDLASAILASDGQTTLDLGDGDMLELAGVLTGDLDDVDFVL